MVEGTYPPAEPEAAKHGEDHGRPLISVVLSTCGRPELALVAIGSVMDDASASFELLVIDQDAKSPLPAKLKSIYGDDPRLRYFLLDRAGLSRARNFGVQQATADIIAFLDDDAVVDPGWLAAIEKTFTAVTPQPGFMGGRLRPIWSAPRPEWYPVECEHLLGLYDIGDQPAPFPPGHLPIGANMAGLKRVIQQHGGFEESLGFDHSRKESMIGGEESLLCQRIADAGLPLYYQPAASARHRISAGKLSVRYFLRRHFWEGVTLITRMNLANKIHPVGAGGIVGYHARAVTIAGFRFLVGSRDEHDSHVSAWIMFKLSQIAYSLGVIYAARKLGKPARAIA